jgi:hypothetical protein
MKLADDTLMVMLTGQNCTFNTCRKNIRKYELEFDEYHNTGGPTEFLK